MSYNEQALFLLNDERAARRGIDYGHGAVKGMLFIGFESHITSIAQGHADWLVANNEFSHYGKDGLNSMQRIDKDPVIGGSGCSDLIGTVPNCCHEHIAYAENISGYWTQHEVDGVYTKGVIARSVYDWIYRDAALAWGHREMCLLQDDDLHDWGALDPWGFSDNYSSPNIEGFIGVGVSTGSNHKGFKHVDIVVLNYFDPVDASSNNDCIYDTAPLELVSFAGTQKTDKIVLNWSTLSEEDGDYFTLEKSEDGINFVELTKESGSNDVQKETSYQYEDNDPFVGTNYYRVKHQNFEGGIKKTISIAVTYSLDANAVISPNPLPTDYLNLAYIAPKEGELRVVVTDAGGKLLINKTFSVSGGSNNLEINTKMLPSGIFILRTIQDENVRTEKFIKL